MLLCNVVCLRCPHQLGKVLSLFLDLTFRAHLICWNTLHGLDAEERALVMPHLDVPGFF